MTQSAVERPSPEGERRQLTVLFCDLVDSTALATQLDPEELREVVRAYQRVCAEVIQRFEGYIAQYLGDGLLVYFGYPQAHEDDGQRAVRAALGMVEAMGRLNQQLAQERGVQLAVRMGIHTGLVVVGAMGGGGRQEQLALGDTPNMAARLQALAAPNTIVIGAATLRLIRGAFACQDLGAHTLKGVATPVQVFRVLREHDEQSRLDMALGGGLTPLVGREQEVGLLLERWAQVKDGHGQVVLLSGEAGIGKSRLVQVVIERITGERHAQLDWRGSPYHQQSPLYPMIARLPRQLGWRQEDSHQEKLHKLEKVLGRHGFSLPDVVPLFATLLALPLPDHYPPLALSPQWQKHKILETLLLWLLRETERQPVLFIVEDLHWLDPSTLEFLGLLVDQAATMRLFALLTCRPTFRSPWAPHAHLTQMTLSRLPRHQASLLIEQVAEGRALPAEVHQQLLTRTDGVPLFVEELTKMVLESEWFQHWQDQDVGSAGTVAPSKPLPQLTIPATLQDSLTARLDRLETGKLVAQLGATIGRRFSYELLRAVSPVDEATLQQALGRLVEAELLYRRGLPPQATYLFKHALIQEAAYQSLLKSMRQRYHQQIAQALVERFPETIETQPELLAHHYTEAGLAAQAVPYWLRAGQRATERSANVEAISHLTEGLELLKTLPDTPERVQHEFALQMALGAPLLMIKGHTAPEVEHAYTRALELCQHMGDDLQRFSALAALWGLYLTRPQFQTARDLAAQGFALAQRMEDQAFLQEAHVMLGAPLFYLGELVSARAHLEQGVALYHPQPGRGWVFRLGADPGVRSFAWAAWTLWLLGYPDRALATMAEALSTARQVAHAYTLAWVLHYTATLHGWCGEIDSAREQAEAEIRLSNEQGFVRWSAGGMTRRGWSLAMQGAIEEGIAELRQGVATWRVRAGEMGLSSILAQQAEAFGRGGYLKEGLDVLAEALAIVHRNAEHYYEAELHRLKGELLRSGAQRPQAGIPQAAVAEAEACFRRALNVARRQEAKSLELRAALSLSRLWQTQDKRKDARQLLTEIYGWFSEGFDTRDLQEARALLATLA